MGLQKAGCTGVIYRAICAGIFMWPGKRQDLVSVYERENYNGKDRSGANMTLMKTFYGQVLIGIYFSLKLGD